MQLPLFILRLNWSVERSRFTAFQCNLSLYLALLFEKKGDTSLRITVSILSNVKATTMTIRLDSLSTLEVCDLLKTNGCDFKELGLIALGDRAGNNANKTRSSETNTSGSHKVLHSFFELWFSKTFTYIWYFTACTLYTSHFQNVATVSSVRVILTHPLQIVQQAILAIFVIHIYIVIQAVKGGLLIHIWICFHVMHYHHHHTCMHIGWGRWRRGYWYLHTQQGCRRQQIGRCECYTMRIVCMFHWWQRGAYVRTLRQLRVL